jgi:E3 ubiquitin-protein ligase RNF139
MNVQPDIVTMDFKGQGILPTDNHTANVSYFDRSYVVNATQTVMLWGCDGVIPLLGMTTIVSKLTHYLGLFLALLVDSNNEDDKNMGTMCGILFFVLALQTGLTRLEPTKRLIRLCRNFCLLSTAILHFIHSMIHPVLMNISASRAVPTSKHLRVLSMCLFLLVFPVCLLCYLWTRNLVSPWLLAVTAFSIEVMIKVLISLLIYALFMLDSLQDVFWEQLDDYIYYIKATGNTIEFLFGIFLFCNGAWILLFESGGMIRAVMMCIHAYFNIWMQACEGWKVFMQRRTAVHKINSLPEATLEQLREHDDVCSICHETLETARITACNHYFHGVCLRKWLYHQDSCPMCHQSVYKQPKTPSDDRPQQQAEAQNAQAEQDNHLHQD